MLIICQNPHEKRGKEEGKGGKEKLCLLIKFTLTHLNKKAQVFCFKGEFHVTPNIILIESLSHGLM